MVSSNTAYMSPTEYFMRQMIVFDQKSETVDRVAALVRAWKEKVRATHVTSPGMHFVENETEISNATLLGTGGQMVVLCKRNMTRLIRDKFALKARLSQSVFNSIIVGLIFWHTPTNQSGIRSFSGAFFFIVINQFFSAASPALIATTMDLSIMTRECNRGLYRAWVWYGSKNMTELVFQVLIPLVFLTPLYFMVGFGPNDLTLFSSIYLFIVLIVSCATGLGYMVSILTRSPTNMPIIGITIILLLLFLNTDQKQAPVYCRWLESISPLKYGYRGISRAFWSSIPVIDCAPGQSCSATSGAQVLKNLSFDQSSMLMDAVHLIVLNIACRLLGILSLCMKIRNKNYEKTMK
jgi:hypothetical protein